ncbi:hypothetical protein L1987_77229 [Smallanthus sonchifolius]|uniref:Uncharacterized protein n=1 Tax=Smallanthus sonchifolius TaxID=185202 RepID=A0ACB8Z990_9ASTR|nr:hypothetical protein L1987_77229 [Smallanthus sonchifolius]
MASLVVRVIFRSILALLLLFVLFHVGRPLYWKISATIHDLHQHKHTGFSEIVMEALKLMGWYDNSGVGEGIQTSRRLLIRKVL